MAGLDWGPYMAGRPFHICAACGRDQEPSAPAYCDECERVKRNSGQYPQIPEWVSSKTPPGSPTQTP